MYNKELFIFGEPIETDYGKVKFLTYKEYLVNVSEVSAISLNVLHIYYFYREMLKDKDDELLESLKEIKEERLYNVIIGVEEFREAYLKIFSIVLDSEERALEVLSDEEAFVFMRKLVMDMNMIIEAEVSPNEEVQKGIEISRELKQQNAEKQSFDSVVTSIVAGTNNSFKDVCDMTVLQVYSLYYRLGAFKAYDTTTLFATVSDDVQIENWSKHIDLFETETSSIDKKTFDKKYGGLLK